MIWTRSQSSAHRRGGNIKDIKTTTKTHSVTNSHFCPLSRHFEKKSPNHVSVFSLQSLLQIVVYTCVYFQKHYYHCHSHGLWGYTRVQPQYLASLYIFHQFVLFSFFLTFLQTNMLLKIFLFNPIIICPLFLLSLATTAQFRPESPSFLVARHLIIVMIIIIMIIIICITDQFNSMLN